MTDPQENKTAYMNIAADGAPSYNQEIWRERERERSIKKIGTLRKSAESCLFAKVARSKSWVSAPHDLQAGLPKVFNAAGLEAISGTPSAALSVTGCHSSWLH